MMTTAPSAAGANAHVLHKETVGAWAAQFIADEAPLAGALVAGLWNHFAPAIARMLVPTSLISAAVSTVLGKMSAAVQGQAIAFSVPSGFLSDIVTEIEVGAPGFIDAIHHWVDPKVTAAAKAIGIL